MRLEIKSLNSNDDILILSIEESESITSILGNFNSDQQYGLGIEMKGLDDKTSVKFLHKIAKRFLPVGTMYDIRAGGKVGFYDPLTPDKVTAAAWFYSPVKDRKIFGCLSGEKFKTEWTPFTFESGCFKLGPFFVE